jgi:hypothetical protein
MARKEQVVCDVCGKLKQETNHWFLLALSFNIQIAKADGQIDREGDLFDLCGEACVLRKVSELIGK